MEAGEVISAVESAGTEIVIAEIFRHLKVTPMPEAAVPPPLPDQPEIPRVSQRAIVLSLLIVMFLISGLVSFLDDTLLLFNRTDLTLTRALVVLLMLPVGFITYLVVACSPGVPKRVFLPIALFIPVVNVAVLPLLIYFHSHAAWITWGASLFQLLAGYLMIHHLRTGERIVWPLFPESRLIQKKFRWSHFAAVMLAGAFVLIPALLACVAFSAKLAIGRFTDGFVELRGSGLVMDVREYERDDGRKITLVPMSHVGESGFYAELSQSFPDNAVVLLEGVSDHANILTIQTGYSRIAEAAGVVEQQKHFKPRGRLVAADIDLSEFSPETLDLLKAAMLIHSKGVTAETMPILMKPTPPNMQRQLMHDILTKRNHHLLKVIHEQLPEAGHIIVPWGAAHMPEIAAEIQKSGFKQTASREMTAIRFGTP